MELAEEEKPVFGPVYLVIRRKKRSIFLEATEDTEVSEIKRMLEPIIKVPVYNQRLYNEITETGIAPESSGDMSDDKLLLSFGITTALAKPAAPIVLGLTVKLESGVFEDLLIVPYSPSPNYQDAVKMSPEEDASQGDSACSDVYLPLPASLSRPVSSP